MLVRASSNIGGVVGTQRFVAHGDDGAMVAGPRAVVVGMTHGNEIVGEAVLTRLAADAPKKLIGGSLLLLRNNLEAQAIDKRHTDGGVDLNRLWDRDALDRIAGLDPQARCYEHRRVLEVAPLLLECDAILDLHSTSRPSPLFLVFRDDPAHAELALKLGVPRLVTGIAEYAILDGGTVPEVGLRAGERSPRLGFLLESGQHRDPANLDRAHAVAERFLHAIGIWRDAPPLPPEPARVYEITDRVVQSPANVERWRFVGFEGGEPGAGRRGAPRSLASFDEIEADEMILRRGTEVRRANVPFTMLLPTPTADPGTDLYYEAHERPELSGSGARTDAEARGQALAIERMLGLLDDDEAARGITRVGFDAREVLDRCAEAIVAALRLAPDDPHRRITVVGRGDFGGDERERRAVQRYRSAMEAARSADVRIDRYQLLRGAPLGWIASLADHATRLFLAPKHPHTVSLLVVGDPDRALADGDSRRIRIAVLVEAATTEIDADDATVRIVRAGLFSARREFLATAIDVIARLREEHAHYIASEVDPRVRTWLDADGALSPPAEQRDELRRWLVGRQLLSWSESVHAVLPEAVHVPSGRVGAEIGRIAVDAGILDPEGLRALIATDSVDGTELDPDCIEIEADAIRLPQARGRELPPVPVRGAEVGTDTFERWLGWKRRLRLTRALLDTNGVDFDLAFEESEIAARAGACFAAARRLAQQAPGRVMVVVAGGGLKPSPRGSRDRGGAQLGGVHRDVLSDPNLSYLRIQYAQGTHFSWLREVLSAIAARPPGGAPVGLQWESAHGGVLNSILVCTRSAATSADPFSLQGWEVERCTVLLSTMRNDSGQRIGLFTEPAGSRLQSAELCHFARSHCEKLLAQGGPRVLFDGTGDLDSVVIEQIAMWIESARSVARRAHLSSALGDLGDWVQAELGIADPRLADALVREIKSPTPARSAARAIWASVPSWDAGLA